MGMLSSPHRKQFRLREMKDRKMEIEEYDKKVQTFAQAMSHNTPDINAQIAYEAAIEIRESGNPLADARVEAAFQVESGNTGAADFLGMIIGLAAKK
jgi:hypothetical protein